MAANSTILSELTRLVVKPVVGPKGAKPWSLVIVSALVWAFGLAAVAWASGMRLEEPLGALMFFVLILVGDSLVVPVTPKMQVTCSDVFWVTAFLVLPTGDAALVCLAGVAAICMRAAQSMQMVAIIGASIWNYLVPLAAVTLVLDLAAGGGPEGMAIGAVAAFAAMRVTEAVYFGWMSLFMEPGGLRPRLRAARAEMRAMFDDETLVQVAAQAPMSTLGALAYPVAPWAAILLLVPYFVSWRSVRQAQQLEVAERLIGIDPLTGMGNRGRFLEQAAREIELAQRFGHGLALIMGDLDNFKRVNDTLGHNTGDEVLKATAATLMAGAQEDLFPTARYGGEEFVILVPALDRAQVLELGEKLRSSVEEALSEWGTSITLGVAYLRENDEIDTLVDRADKALYSAKFAGKNRVHEWRDGIERPIAA